MLQILNKLYKSRTSKYAAILLLAVVINFVLAPMSVVFLQPKTAQAQSELMMPLMIMTMIFQMISSLMQMGGGQQGGGEEQPPQNAGTVGPSNSGPQNSGNPSASASPSTTSTLCEKTVFLAGSGTSFTIAPETVSIVPNSCVNVLNATTDTSSLVIRKKGETTGTTREITTSKMEIFNFATKGVYEVCQKVGEALSCKATVTVE